MNSKEKIDLDDCHNDNTIWGMAVKASFQLADNSVCQKDHLLHCLIRIGIHDWTGINVWGPEGIWSMTYTVVMGNCLFRLMEDESVKVR